MAKQTTSTEPISQRAIRVEDEKSAPSVEQDKTQATASAKRKPFVKSRKKTSLDEFAIVNNLRPEVKAGFKVWLDGKLYHFDDEWKKLFSEYMNR